MLGLPRPTGVWTVTFTQGAGLRQPWVHEQQSPLPQQPCGGLPRDPHFPHGPVPFFLPYLGVLHCGEGLLRCDHALCLCSLFNLRLLDLHADYIIRGRELMELGVRVGGAVRCGGNGKPRGSKRTAGMLRSLADAEHRFSILGRGLTRGCTSAQIRSWILHYSWCSQKIRKNNNIR